MPQIECVRYGTYPTPYVRALERHKSLSLFLIGLLLGIMLYGAYRSFYSHSEHAAEVDKLNAQIDVLQLQLSELTEWQQDYEQQVDKAKGYIRKHNPKLSPDTVDKIARLEVKHSRKYDVPLALGLAITLKESTFDCGATSPTGPVGCKQIAASWWASELGLTRKQLYDPALNIEAGYKIIHKLFKQEKSWQKALQRYYGDKDVTINQAYASKVLRVAANY